MMEFAERKETLGKTLLICAGRLTGLIEKIDKRVKNIAFNSGCFFGEIYDCQYFCNKIEKLIVLKAEYLVIKKLADGLLSAMDYRFKQALKFKYIKDKSIYDTADALGISVRSAYRLIKTGLNIFSDNLCKSKDFEVFYNFIMKERWASDIMLKCFAEFIKSTKRLDLKSSSIIKDGFKTECPAVSV